jgi:kinetochore protein Spc25
MAASFEPSHSTSHRAPAEALDAATMINELPSVDFGFDELRDVMTRFTKRFDTFIANGRRHILDERNQYHLNVAELEGMYSDRPALRAGD